MSRCFDGLFFSQSSRIVHVLTDTIGSEGIPSTNVNGMDAESRVKLMRREVARKKISEGEERGKCSESNRKCRSGNETDDTRAAKWNWGWFTRARACCKPMRYQLAEKVGPVKGYRFCINPHFDVPS